MTTGGAQGLLSNGMQDDVTHQCSVINENCKLSSPHKEKEKALTSRSPVRRVASNKCHSLHKI